MRCASKQLCCGVVVPWCATRGYTQLGTGPLVLHLKAGSPRSWELVPGICLGHSLCEALGTAGPLSVSAVSNASYSPGGHHEVLVGETNPSPIADATLL